MISDYQMALDGPHAAVPRIGCHRDETGMRREFVAVGLWLAGERQPRDDGGSKAAQRLRLQGVWRVGEKNIRRGLELRGQPFAVADVVDKDVQQRNLGGGGGGPNAERAAKSGQHVGCEGVGGECRQGGDNVEVKEGCGHAVQQLPVHARQVVEGG